MTTRIKVPYRIIGAFGPDYVGDNGKDEIIYKCPQCISRKGTPDLHGHLYVNVNSYKYFCVRCEWSGRLDKSTKVDNSKIYDEEQDTDAVQLLREASSELFNHPDKLSLRIPLDKVTSSRSATEYLLNRGFTYEQMEYYDMRVGNTTQEFGRIIIPNITDSRKVFTDMYSARSFIGQTPKYHNPFSAKKSEIVFNLHRVQSGTPLILVEGALTAVAAGYHAVASLGKSLSNYQASLVAKKKPSLIYVNYDYGAESNSRDACRLLRRYLPDTPIYEVLMDSEKDADDLSRDEYLKCLQSARLYDPLISDIMSLV